VYEDLPLTHWSPEYVDTLIYRLENGDWSEPEKRIPAKAKEIWWANTGRTVVLDDDLGLAPGDIQQFYLVRAPHG
jgi:hypothetical protein